MDDFSNLLVIVEEQMNMRISFAIIIFFGIENNFINIL